MSESPKHGIPDEQRRRVSAGIPRNGEHVYLSVWREGADSYLEDATGKRWRLRRATAHRFTLAEVIPGRKQPRKAGQFVTEAHRAFAEWLAAHALIADHGAVPLSYTPKARRR